MNYILITPIKDEAENLCSLRDTVLNQSILPVLWVIIDGESNDGSFNLAKQIFREYNWVHIIKQKKFFEKNYSHKNFALAVNQAYEFAKKFSQLNNITYKYIGKIDATVRLSENYFEFLIQEMEENAKLAIVSGLRNYSAKTQNVSEISVNDMFMEFGDIRLYSKKYWEQINGYPITFSPDTILLVKALNNGWHINVSKRASYLETRKSGSKIGSFKGYRLMGRAMYNLGYHPVLVISNSIYQFFMFNFDFNAFAIAYGYVLSYSRNEERIQDKELLDFFGKKRIKQLFLQMIHRFNKE